MYIFVYIANSSTYNKIIVIVITIIITINITTIDTATTTTTTTTTTTPGNDTNDNDNNNDTKSNSSTTNNKKAPVARERPDVPELPGDRRKGFPSTRYIRYVFLLHVGTIHFVFV